VEEIEAEFAISKGFFDLPAEVKGKTPHDTKTNNGWEYKVSGLVGSSVTSLDYPLTRLANLGPIEAEHGNI
jgi:hypothetical protein